MKRALDLNAVGAALAIGFLLLAEPSLAADDKCRSDSGIPSGVGGPIVGGHLRKPLADACFAVGGFYLGETFANTGGIHQGATYDGVLWTYLIGDLHKAGLWKGLCFYTDAYQIHGRSITADDIGSLVTVSNYEALPSTRLSELLLGQHMVNDHQEPPRNSCFRCASRLRLVRLGAARNVCFWTLFLHPTHTDELPLLGTKRT